LFRLRQRLALLAYMGDQERTHLLKTLGYRIKHEKGKIAAQRGGQGSSVSSMSSRYYQAKIDHCKEIHLALLPPGIATCPQYCKFPLQRLQTALLSRHGISLTEVSFVASHNNAKGSKKRKFERHRSEYCDGCGQYDHMWSSDVWPHPGFNARKAKIEGRMRPQLEQMPRRNLAPSISDRVFTTAGAVSSSASARCPPNSALGMFQNLLLTMLILSPTKAFQDLSKKQILLLF
jgi:hypothetical protein